MGLTRPSLCSAMVQESMKVWAMTESTASTCSDAWTSKMNCGFLMMLIQKRRGRLRRTGGQACVYTQPSQPRCHVTSGDVPVGLPDVDGLRVRDAMLSRLLVQQVEEVFHGQRDRTAGAEDDGEQVIHKLLQRSLESTEEPLDPGLYMIPRDRFPFKWLVISS